MDVERSDVGGLGLNLFWSANCANSPALDNNEHVTATQDPHSVTNDDHGHPGWQSVYGIGHGAFRHGVN